MPAGRPTDYDQAYCDQIIEYMGQGYSKTAFAGKIGVARNTLLNWAEANPEFLRAVKIAEAARVTKLEEGLLSADVGPMVTSRIFALKNADPEEWRDKQSLEHTGKDGEAIQTVSRIEHVIVRPNSKG